MTRDWVSYEEGKREGQSDRSWDGFGYFIVALFLICLFCILFPMPAAFGIGTWFGSSLLLRPLAEAQTGFNRTLIGTIAPYVLGSGALVLGMMAEAKLAGYSVYWWFRHVVRLVLVGAASFAVHHYEQYKSLPRGLDDVARSAAELISLCVVLVAVVAAHFMLWACRRQEVSTQQFMLRAIVSILVLGGFLYLLSNSRL